MANGADNEKRHVFNIEDVAQAIHDANPRGDWEELLPSARYQYILAAEAVRPCIHL